VHGCASALSATSRSTRRDDDADFVLAPGRINAHRDLLNHIVFDLVVNLPLVLETPLSQPRTARKACGLARVAIAPAAVRAP
jgi:hypothetical protein